MACVMHVGCYDDSKDRGRGGHAGVPTCCPIEMIKGLT
jgi:hypothetical protein